MTEPDLLEKMRAFPKVDLHRHLEGSIRVETFLDIARKENVFLPTYNPDQFRRMVQMDEDSPDFINFLNKFKVFRGFYPSRGAIERIAYEAVEDAARDNVRYLELRYSPTHFACGQGFPEQEVICWIQGAIERAMADHDIIVVPIVTISRNYGLDLAENTTRLAVRGAGKYFFGLDLAGDEINFPARPMAHLFSMVKDAGMGLSLHAGEAGGPENVLEAVEEFGADRIGHGVQAAKSERAVQSLIDRRVLLEICLTSNLHTGTVDSLASHPFKLLYVRGVSVSLNTDDPMISNITLSGEYVKALTVIGLTEDDLNRLNLTALEHSFHPDREHLKGKLAPLWT